MSRTVADHFAEILVAAGRTGWLRGKLLSALRSRRNGRVVPSLMSFSTEAVKRSAAEQVPLDVEDVVDGGADGDETLRRNPVEREHVKRRMAAILAADVAGYSRLMGADEEG